MVEFFNPSITASDDVYFCSLILKRRSSSVEPFTIFAPDAGFEPKTHPCATRNLRIWLQPTLADFTQQLDDKT